VVFGSPETDEVYMTTYDHAALLAQATHEYQRYYPAWLLSDSTEHVVGRIAVSMGINGYAEVPFEVRKCVAREVVEKERGEQWAKRE